MIGERPAWTVDAACAGSSPALFFSPKGNTHLVRKAKAICDTCPVKDDCLEFGLTEPIGIWGGLTPKERRVVKRQRGMGRKLQPIKHGTEGGHIAHRRRGEEPCPLCVTAHREYASRLKKDVRERRAS